MHQKKFTGKNFRRILERPEDMASMRDYFEYAVTLNKNASAQQKQLLGRTGSFNKFTNEYFDSTKTTMSPVKHKRDF